MSYAIYHMSCVMCHGPNGGHLLLQRIRKVSSLAPLSSHNLVTDIFVNKQSPRDQKWNPLVTNNCGKE